MEDLEQKPSVSVTYREVTAVGTYLDQVEEPSQERLGTLQRQEGRHMAALHKQDVSIKLSETHG